MLSTNGTRLYTMAEELYDAGINRVNISLDTLDRNKFTKTTGRDMLPQVLKSFDKSVEVFDLVKANTVLERETLEEVVPLIEFSENYTESPVMRFIELVKGGFDGDVEYVRDRYCSGQKVVELIKNEYGDLTKTEVEGDNPMCYYYKINTNGVIFGIVPNFSTNFACAGRKCKKIRLTPTGFISNCSIYQEFGHDMRDTTYEEKLDIMEHIIREKQERGEETYKKLKHYQSDYQFWRFGRSHENE